MVTYCLPKKSPERYGGAGDAGQIDHEAAPCPESVTSGLLLADFAGHTWIAGHALARREVSVLGTVAFVLGRLPSLMALSLRVFLRLVLLALPFLAVAGVVWITTLAGQDINYYLSESPPEWRRAKLVAAVLVAGYVLLAAWQLARWLYALPVLAFERATPAQPLDRSAALTRGRLADVVPLRSMCSGGLPSRSSRSW